MAKKPWRPTSDERGEGPIGVLPDGTLNIVDAERDEEDEREPPPAKPRRAVNRLPTK